MRQRGVRAMLAAEDSGMSVVEHKALSPSPADLRVALLTASDSRTSADDEGGRVLRELAVAAGFTVTGEALLREEPAALRAHVAALAASGAVDAVLVTGGTGLGPRDRTPEALGALFERRLDGFGELFRALSFAEIGAAAMLSRADAGVVGGALVFLLPGSPAAVRLAMERLIVPELAHAVGQMRRASRRHVEAEGPHGHGRR
ncbi:MAG TPA: molybdenum cofactor biosynthesis protein B [Polyangia bacterium]|nr:molybdenum cofactor biosynthesis protein B [Polyangia bacterium]